MGERKLLSMQRALLMTLLALVFVAYAAALPAKVHVLEAAAPKAPAHPITDGGHISPPAAQKAIAPAKAGQPHVFATGNVGIFKAAEKALGKQLNRPPKGEFAKEMHEQAMEEAKTLAGIKHQSLEMATLSTEELGEGAEVQHSLLKGMPMPPVMSAEEIAAKLDK